MDNFPYISVFRIILNKFSLSTVDYSRQAKLALQYVVLSRLRWRNYSWVVFFLGRLGVVQVIDFRFEL